MLRTPRPIPWRALAAAALLLAAAPLRAQQPGAPALEGALSGLRPGQVVRVAVRGSGPVEGGFGGVVDGALVVGAGAETARIPAADVRGVWTRGRYTKRGAAVGAGIGGLAGLGIGAFAAILPLETEEDSDAEIVATTTALGLGGGALLGGIVGAAVPRWTQVYPADRRVGAPRMAHQVGGGEAERAPESGGEGAGSLEGAVGYGRISDLATDGGVEGRIALMGRFRPVRGVVLALGPELEFGGFGTTEVMRRVTPRVDCASNPACPVVGQDTTRFRRQYSNVAGRLVARLEPGVGRVRPYVLAGAGAHVWIYREAEEHEQHPGRNDDTYSHPGYTLGGGVRVRRVLGSRSLGMEARRSGVFGAEEDGQPESYWRVSVTVGSN